MLLIKTARKQKKKPHPLSLQTSILLCRGPEPSQLRWTPTSFSWQREQWWCRWLKDSLCRVWSCRQDKDGWWLGDALVSAVSVAILKVSVKPSLILPGGRDWPELKWNIKSLALHAASSKGVIHFWILKMLLGASRRAGRGKVGQSFKKRPECLSSSPNMS